MHHIVINLKKSMHFATELAEFYSSYNGRVLTWYLFAYWLSLTRSITNLSHDETRHIFTTKF